MQPVTTQDKFAAAALFILCCSVYFATLSGITSSNDGSHYALVRALSTTRFEISPYLSFTENQDYAFRDTPTGRLYFSDRPPGTALMAAPLYLLGQVLPAPQPLPSKHDAPNARLMYAVMLSPLSMAGAAAALFLLLRRYFGRSLRAALLASLAFGLGTVAWRYGAVLYSHAASALIIMLALLLALDLASRPFDQPGAYAALGFLLGWAPVVEYTNFVFSAALGLFVMAHVWQNQRPLWRAGAWLALGIALPLGLLAAYNTLNFGGPLELSRFHVDTTLWPENTDVASTFATPIIYGLQGMLWQVEGNANRGLFLLAPVTVLSLGGIPALLRLERAKGLLVLGLFAGYLLLFASSTTFNPGTNDGRYLTPFMALWFVPLAFFLDQAWAARSALLRPVLVGLFGLALALSMRSQLMHIAAAWNYNLDVAALPPGEFIANTGRVLSVVFRNAANLPLLWALLAAVTCLVWLVMRRQAARRPSPSLTDTLPAG